MKIFAIRDGLDSEKKNLAYLFYYEKDKLFFIELPDDADEWETPLLLSSFVKAGEKTVNSYWSRLWVQQRIVPSDRQNLGQVLKENGLDFYDEYELLMLADGRCAQDDYYLVPVKMEELPEEFMLRYRYKVEDVIPLKSPELLVIFRDGIIKKCDVKEFAQNDARFFPIINKEELFKSVEVQIGGYGVNWGENLFLSDELLYRKGIEVPLKREDFLSFVETRIVNTAEAAGLLECSRQNVGDLVRRGMLHPVKADEKNTLFLKTEILQRKWK